MFWAILAFCYKGILLSILQVRNSLVYDKEGLVIPESLSSRCPDSVTKEECPQNSSSRGTAAQHQLTTTKTEVKNAGNRAPCWHFSTAAIALLCSKDCSSIHKVAAHVLGEKPFFHPHTILFCRTEGKIHLFSKYFKKTNHFCFKLTPHTEDVTQQRSRKTSLLCRNANAPKHTSGPLQTGGILCVTLSMAMMHPHCRQTAAQLSYYRAKQNLYTHSSSKASQYQQKKLSFTRYRHFLNIKLFSFSTENGKCDKSRKEAKHLDKVIQGAFRKKPWLGGYPRVKNQCPCSQHVTHQARQIQG